MKNDGAALGENARGPVMNSWRHYIREWLRIGIGYGKDWKAWELSYLKLHDQSASAGTCRCRNSTLGYLGLDFPGTRDTIRIVA
jgi:hypothetical protein